MSSQSPNILDYQTIDDKALITAIKEATTHHLLNVEFELTCPLPSPMPDGNCFQVPLGNGVTSYVHGYGTGMGKIRMRGVLSTTPKKRGAPVGHPNSNPTKWPVRMEVKMTQAQKDRLARAADAAGKSENAMIREFLDKCLPPDSVVIDDSRQTED